MAKENPHWTEDRIPDQHGRTVLITGANSGLGLHSAQVLAQKGARVLLACRSVERGQQAWESVRAVATGAAPELIQLDLADLASVQKAARSIRETSDDRLDILINNAGLMATPKATTIDGFELQFGTNHLGHAALTWLLLPALRNAGRARTAPARIVTLSSLAARGGRFDPIDPNFQRRRYNPGSAYAQSKLANQIFALELDRRLRRSEDPVLSLAAHPGYAATGLGPAMAKSYGNPVVRTVIGTSLRIAEKVIGQNAALGALPQLFAATAPEAFGGDYIGPDKLGGVRGYPKRVAPLPAALSEHLGAELWDVTAKLTGVTPDPT